MGQDFEPEHFLGSFFRTAKTVLLSPRTFYEGMNRQGGLRNPFIFLTCCVILHTVMVSLVSRDQALAGGNLILGIGMPFVTAGILFLILTRLFKALGSYEGAFRVNAYAGAVSIFSWIPLAGLVLEFYRIYLIVVGLSCVFSAKPWRSLLAVLITMAVYMVLGVALFHGRPGA